MQIFSQIRAYRLNQNFQNLRINRNLWNQANQFKICDSDNLSLCCICPPKIAFNGKVSLNDNF